jgi:hypothetical protein
MENVHAEIEIINYGDLVMAERNFMNEGDVKRMHINVMVNSKTWMLCINENIQSLLNLPFVRKEKVRRTDGQIEEYDIAGSIEIRFDDQKAYCEAIVLPADTQPVLGKIPINKLHLMVDSQRQELVVDPRPILLPSIRPVGMVK